MTQGGAPWDPLQAAIALGHILKFMTASDDVLNPTATTGLGRMPSTNPASYNYNALLAPFTEPQSVDLPVVGPSSPTGANTGATGDRVNPLPGELNVGEGRDFSPGGEIGRVHKGEDLYATMDTPVVSPSSGTITVADGNGGDGGNQMYIQLDSGELIKFFHLDSFNVKVGDHVAAGQLVALSGNTGQSSGPHLHMEVWQDGSPIDPVDWLQNAIQSAAPHTVEEPKPGQITKTTTVTPATEEQRMGAAASNLLFALTGKLNAGNYSQSGQPTVGSKTDITIPDNSGIKEGAVGNVQSTGHWAEDILRGIGAPVNPETIRVMEAWFRLEGMNPSLNNPLATTLNTDEVTSTINSAGVHGYSTYEAGLQATIQTLLQSNMASIVNALRGGGTAAQMAYGIGHSPWIGNDPSAQENYYQTLLRILGG